MSEVIEESFEYRRDMLGPIDRCNVTCGSYGDKFHRWDDSGPYVEYEDHVKHISLYSAELDAQRLRADTAEAELDVLKKALESAELEVDTKKEEIALSDQYAKYQDERVAAAEQRIAELRELLRLMTVEYACCLEAGYDRITFLGGDCDSVSKMLADNVNYAKACAALNPNPEAESHEG